MESSAVDYKTIKLIVLLYLQTFKLMVWWYRLRWTVGRRGRTIQSAFSILFYEKRCWSDPGVSPGGKDREGTAVSDTYKGSLWFCDGRTQKLLDKRNALKRDEIMAAVVKSKKSYDEIMKFLAEDAWKSPLIFWCFCRYRRIRNYLEWWIGSFMWWIMESWRNDQNAFWQITCHWRGFPIL